MYNQYPLSVADKSMVKIMFVTEMCPPAGWQVAMKTHLAGGLKPSEEY